MTTSVKACFLFEARKLRICNATVKFDIYFVLYFSHLNSPRMYRRRSYSNSSQCVARHHTRKCTQLTYHCPSAPSQFKYAAHATRARRTAIPPLNTASVFIPLQLLTIIVVPTHKAQRSTPTYTKSLSLLLYSYPATSPHLRGVLSEYISVFKQYQRAI